MPQELILPAESFPTIQRELEHRCSVLFPNDMPTFVVITAEARALGITTIREIIHDIALSAHEGSTFGFQFLEPMFKKQIDRTQQRQTAIIWNVDYRDSKWQSTSADNDDAHNRVVTIQCLNEML